MENLNTKYNPKDFEKKWYEIWEKNGYFHEEVDPSKKPFCVVMPPPNVTGQLHLGHAMDNTLQDILVRYKRMQGFNTLWVPGVDHAGIATQAKVEENLKKSGISKNDLGREKFLDEVWKWKDEYHERITSQLRLLGSSCDWERERFTLDEGCSHAVKEVFVRLYEKGLIYRGKYIVNWCPTCHTTISDIEVEHEEQPGNLWHIKYMIEGSEEFIEIATTRPETLLGDTAVAVNPEDPRYKDHIGKTLIVPIVGRKIKLIADDYVTMDFGTGAVKITPSHDPNDFDMAGRHNLEFINVIDKLGKMCGPVGVYQGMDRYECRDAIVADLKKANLLVKVENHDHKVGVCYRCNTVIEPSISTQWFVKMDTMAKRALDAVVQGESTFIPQRFSKVYESWLSEIKDWCISRQLWWGHRIPVWYCSDCNEMTVSKDEVHSCSHCQSKNIKQDEDVLDTWFSSALWPFSTLGWPDNKELLDQFYPNSVMVTGRDIIFFWVARMMFMSLEFMNEVPYPEIFIHGLILDSEGRKMSKSLGNGIDPLELIEEYGADTLRFMLITGNTPGNDIRFHRERLDGIRNFCNKIWNASRFLIMNLENVDQENLVIKEDLLKVSDKWILSKYNEMVKEVTAALDTYDLGVAGDLIYDFLWNSYCDWYIELSKDNLYKGGQEEKENNLSVLNYVLQGTLKLLHPFMPFLTEEIYQLLPQSEETIMKSSWPIFNGNYDFPLEKKNMEEIMEGIKVIRNIRSTLNVPLNKKCNILIYSKEESLNNLRENKEYFLKLCSSEEIEILSYDDPRMENCSIGVTNNFEIYLPLMGLLDLKEEKERLNKELKKIQGELKRIEGKLGNDKFISKAPKEVIDKEKEKYASYEEKYKVVEERLKTL